MKKAQVILITYTINTNTKALLPAKEIEYCTIAMDGDEIIPINKPSFPMINDACLAGGSSYEGRKKSIIHKAGEQKKVPAAVSPEQGIYAIPTHSPKNPDCAWIFYHHIERLSISDTCKNHCKVHFKDGTNIIVPVSLQAMKQRLYRTCYYISLFANKNN